MNLGNEYFHKHQKVERHSREGGHPALAEYSWKKIKGATLGFPPSRE